ncbi:MAG TPA: DUF1326 domain-containing protein [Gemmataceae bacterium]|nr:DUF1326 domain-containing protein [Gemmataceae bacterium]
MIRKLSFALLTLGATLAIASHGFAADKAAVVSAKGIYVEARTCDVWTGPCFANADFNIGGKQGVMAWRIDKGQIGDVKLDGLSVVAVICASNTIGLEQHAPAKAVVIVDKKATAEQRDALVRFAQQQGGKLVANVVRVHSDAIKINFCPCTKNACAEVDATVAKVTTRCLNTEHDKVCGNEFAFYPPMANNVKAIPAGIVEHAFRGQGLGETWSDSDRRAGYVGSFETR